MKLSGYIKNLRKAVGLAALSTIAAALPLSAQVSLTGAGATFPAPIYTKWFSTYQSIGNVQINYQAIGSGGGIKGVTEGTVDFGASDAALTNEQLATFKTKNGRGLLMFPTVLGAAVPTYNLPGVSGDLNFSGDALAGIFLGKITKWNDPTLAKDNPGVKLPATDIVVVHRAESSGTTYCWTDYLSKVSAEWKSKIGTSAAVSWPVGLGAKGSDGVAGLLKQQPGSIGYVELVFAKQNNLAYGKVKNKSGKFVKGDLKGVTAAAAALKEMPADFRVSITDQTGNDVYPISTFTWLLVPDKFDDASKQKALVGFLKWATSKGQDSVEALDYARLPKSVIAKEEKQIALIK
jgi:phosphate transport system substrate-binding protein